MKKTLRKTIILLLALVCSVCAFAACGGETSLESLISEYGIVVEGGGFKQGSTLVSKVIELTGEEGKAALEAIKNQEYDKDGEVYVYDISVLLDGVKVQPDGKVKVTIPISDLDLSGYDVLHIKDSGVIEKLSATYADGKITFETDSFSIFVLVEKAKYIFLAQSYLIEGGYLVENGNEVDFGNGRIVDNGTQITLTAVANEGYDFKGWYCYDESLNEVSISSQATYTFAINQPLSVYAKFEEKLLYNFLAQCDVDVGGYITENGARVDFGNGRMVDSGTQITLTAVANEGYDFRGWATRDEDWNAIIFSTNAKHTFTVNESVVDEYGRYYVQAIFREKANGLRIDAHNAGFTYNESGELTTTVYVIGSENKPNIEHVGVYATYPSQSVQDEYLELNVDYTRDLGGLDFNKAGTYTVTYTYKANTSLTVSLTVEVVEKD